MSNNASVGEAVRALRFVAPSSPDQLANYIKAFMAVQIPRTAISQTGSPFEYLWYAYSTELAGRVSGDCVVWANRGGGKTLCGAILSVLDMVLRPGCEVKILAGSAEQASRMYDYVVGFVEKGYADLLAGKITRTGLALQNGSSIEILTQSARNVRGRHIHKLRCDEVEMFDKDVFQAAQFITKSSPGRTAAMELASTMHRPYGLMRDVVKMAEQTAMPVFRWSLWDVIEKCQGRSCSACPLYEDCRGQARDADGYYLIDDAISQMKRASRMSWEAEMLCKRPMLENCVFPDFDKNLHIRENISSPSRCLYRAIDFGYVNPFVCLWIEVDDADRVYVLGEYVRRQKTTQENAREVVRRTPGGERSVCGTFCDPAGSQRTNTTGTSAADEMRSEGIDLRWRASRIIDGLEMIRKHLKNAEGEIGLYIDPSCKKLIEAMECYHYPKNSSENELPDKDGIYDHYIDALRYFFVNYKNAKTNIKRY